MCFICPHHEYLYYITNVRHPFVNWRIFYPTYKKQGPTRLGATSPVCSHALSSAFQFQSIVKGLAYDGTDQAIGHGSDVEDDGLQFVVVDFAVCQD